MSVRGANPQEIYEDEHGDRWLVLWTMNEPSLCMQRLYPRFHESDPLPPQQSGGVSGLMWEGFKKIAEAPKHKEESATNLVSSPAAPLRGIANTFGVSPNTVARIAAGKSWVSPERAGE